MQLPQAMEVLSAHLGSAVTPNSQGAYRLVFDDRLVIEAWNASDTTFIVSHTLFGLPVDQSLRNHFFKDLLQLNYSLLGSLPHTLALDGEQNTLIIYQTFYPETLYEDTFMKQLEIFLNTLEFWHKIIILNNNPSVIASSSLFVP